MMFLIFHVTSQLKCHVAFWVEPPHLDSAPYQVLGLMNFVNVDIKRFWFFTWPRDWCITWLCGWGPLNLSHQPAKFGVHRPCESGDITFFICHVTTISSVTWLDGWGPLILNHHPARCGIHRPYVTGKNGVCSISSNSNSNSNADVPMLRFTNGRHLIYFKFTHAFFYLMFLMDV